MTKRFRSSLALFLAFLLVVSCAAGAVAYALQLGDVDGSGKVNSSDARLTLRAAARLETLTSEQFAAADADGNGKVNATDARKILRAAAKIEALPSAAPPTESGNGHWELYGTRVQKNENANSGTAVYQLYVGVGEHYCYMSLPGDTTQMKLSGFCSDPPEKVAAGERVVMDMRLELDIMDYGKNRFVLYNLSSVRLDTQPDLGFAEDTDDVVLFRSVQNDGKDRCSVTSENGPGTDTASVACVFPQGAAGDTVAVYFNACGSETVWMYSWVADEAAPPTEPTAPSTEPVQSGHYAWVKTDTRVLGRDNATVGRVTYNYYANELEHSCSMLVQETGLFASFYSTCSAAPEQVEGGGRAVFSLTLQMTEYIEGSDGGYFNAQARVRRDKPDLPLNSSTQEKVIFQSAEPDRNEYCDIDSNTSVTYDSVQVYDVFPQGVPGQRIGVYFAACGTETCWTYEWKPVSDSPTDSTQPSVSPTEPSEPWTEPTEPSTEPTQPSTEPTTEYADNTINRVAITGADLDQYKSDGYEIIALDSITVGGKDHVALDDYETVEFDFSNVPEKERENYLGVYFDDNGKPVWYYPDPDALAEGKFRYEVLHFSPWGVAKPTEQKLIDSWCERAAAQGVTRRISEDEITPSLKDMVADTMGAYGLGKDQYAGAIVRYILSHDTRGEILTAAADGDMEALRAKVINYSGEYFLGKFLKGEGDEIITQSFGDHEAAIRKGLKDGDFATASLEIVKNIEKNMFPAVNYAEKFGQLVNKLADIWADNSMNEQYENFAKMMDREGRVSNDDWNIIYYQLHGAMNRLSQRGVGSAELRAMFEQRYAKYGEIYAEKERLKGLVAGWKNDNMFDDIYWYGSGRFFNHPSVTEKLNSLMALHDMLKREFLTVNGQFRKGKSFEWSSDEEFISAAMQKWLGDRSPGKNEFIQWLRDEGLLKTPRVTYTPDWVWVLIDTRTEIPETYKTDVYRTTYSGSTNSFSKTDEYIWDPDHYQSASFTVTCSPSPPEIIRVGDKVVMDLTAAITSNNDEDFHWGASCGVRRDRPDMGLGSAYRGYESFWATVEGEPNTCSVEAIGDWGNAPVRITSAQVYHEFGGPGAENAQDIETADGHIYRIGVYFTGCSCQTVWTYEWRNIAG